jgi:hypothetical protein
LRPSCRMIGSAKVRDQPSGIRQQLTVRIVALNTKLELT